MVSEPPSFLGNKIEPNKNISANITIRNIGKTPADKYGITASLIPYSPKDRRRYKVFIRQTFDEIERKNAVVRNQIEQFDAEADVAPNGYAFITENTPGISGDALLKVQAGEIAIFYVGLVSYTDAFNLPYETEFCWYHIGDDPRVWNICDTHNTVK